MESVSPVFGEAEVDFEKVIALDQPQYLPIVTLSVTVEAVNNTEAEITTAAGDIIPVNGHYLIPNWGMALRLRLSDEERGMIAAGADIVITEVLYGSQFTPLNLQLCKPGERPEF